MRLRGDARIVGVPTGNPCERQHPAAAPPPGAGRASSRPSHSLDEPGRTEAIGTLLPNQTVWHPLSLDRTDFGPDGLTLTIDSDDLWPECDEANNTWTLAWPCPD